MKKRLNTIQFCTYFCSNPTEIETGDTENRSVAGWGTSARARNWALV